MPQKSANFVYVKKSNSASCFFQEKEKIFLGKGHTKSFKLSNGSHKHVCLVESLLSGVAMAKNLPICSKALQLSSKHLLLVFGMITNVVLCLQRVY